MTIEETIRAVQNKLGVEVDGRAGPQTWNAIHTALIGKPKVETGTGKLVDERSEKTIATLLPEVRPLARALVESAKSIGIEIKVISGTRSYQEQADLYAKGRSKPGRIVTNAKPGYSNHNFGTAFDIGVFDGPKYIPESPAYKAVGALGVKLGLEWGGNWKSIVDEPHFQLRPSWAKGMKESAMLAELRERREDGRNVFA